MTLHRFHRQLVTFCLIANYAITGALVVSCSKNTKKSERELDAAGYKTTPADFLRAASKGDTHALKLLVQQGVSTDATDSEGLTALHLAALANHQEAATFLLDAGLSIDATTKDLSTPLMLAAQHGKAPMVRFLLKQGANPALKDQVHRSALIVAIDANQPACAEELAPFSRSQLDTALLYAAAQGKYHVISTLTSFGASVYTRHDGGMTPLMLAAQNGHTTTVYALLKSGSNRYAINEHGWTAAQVAEAANQQAIATILNRDPSADDLSITSPSDTENVVWSDTDTTTSSTPPTSHPTSATTPPNQPHSTSVATQHKKGSLPWNRPTTTKSTEVLDSLNSPPTPTQNRKTIPFIAGKTLTTPATTPDELAKDLHMRDYQQKNLPLIIEKTTPTTAEVRMLYGKNQKVLVRKGDTIPGTHFQITKIQRKIHDSKTSDGQPTDVSIVEILDTKTGKRRQLTTQIPATATEPWAILQTSTNQQTFAARAGQSFQTTTGDTYTITDVRPTQIILTHQKTNQTITIPLGQ